jgi:hypothetical protein
MRWRLKLQRNLSGEQRNYDQPSCFLLIRKTQARAQYRRYVLPVCGGRAGMAKIWFPGAAHHQRHYQWRRL